MGFKPQSGYAHPTSSPRATTDAGLGTLAGSLPLTFRLVEAPGAAPAVCRCGTRLPGGERRLEAHPAAEPLQELFLDESFCSLVCVRAFVRETLEMLDGAARPGSAEICSDLRDLVLDLEQVWASLARNAPRATRVY